MSEYRALCGHRGTCIVCGDRVTDTHMNQAHAAPQIAKPESFALNPRSFQVFYQREVQLSSDDRLLKRPAHIPGAACWLSK